MIIDASTTYTYFFKELEYLGGAVVFARKRILHHVYSGMTK